MNPSQHLVSVTRCQAICWVILHTPFYLLLTTMPWHGYYYPILQTKKLNFEEVNSPSSSHSEQEVELRFELFVFDPELCCNLRSQSASPGKSTHSTDVRSAYEQPSPLCSGKIPCMGFISGCLTVWCPGGFGQREHKQGLRKEECGKVGIPIPSSTFARSL